MTEKLGLSQSDLDKSVFSASARAARRASPPPSCRRRLARAETKHERAFRALVAAERRARAEGRARANPCRLPLLLAAARVRLNALPIYDYYDYYDYYDSFLFCRSPRYRMSKLMPLMPDFYVGDPGDLEAYVDGARKAQNLMGAFTNAFKK
jgi:hypothetical protein